MHAFLLAALLAIVAPDSSSQIDAFGTTVMGFFSVTLGDVPFTYYYDGTQKRGVALLPVWKPPSR